jgi:bacterioferritin-associated ferredoxin
MAVNERTIRECIEAGAHEIEELGPACGAGSKCFGCHPALEDLIREVAGRDK